MATLHLFLILLFPLSVSCNSKQQRSRQDDVDYLLSQLTLAEKISLVHGKLGRYTGNVPGIARLSIPPLNLNDGPQGFRNPPIPGLAGTSTAWPCALAMAASWDRQLVREWGQAMAKEFTLKGANIFLGPGVNVARIPTNGRNFEYLSGEDPVLGAKLVKQEIQGLQKEGNVLATVKHYIHNNQETHRTSISSIVDEQTHWELYMPPFVAALEAGLLAVMCSYNKVNGIYACENLDALTGDLRDKLGFKGFVVSDWVATHSTIPAVQAGLDMEMPVGLYYGRQLKKAIQSQQLNVTFLDTMVQRILYATIALNASAAAEGSILANVTSPEHNQLAREFAAAGVVLLKNDNQTLPLSKQDSILIVGDIVPCGGGSGYVHPPYVISALQGIQGQSSSNVYQTNFKNPKYSQIDSVDKVIVFLSTTSTEGSDRPNMSFPDDQLRVLDTMISKAGHKVIVVAIAPGAVLLPFADAIPALLLSFFPGQEGGNSIADILHGKVTPSGRLPITMPNKENEMQMTTHQYPGVDGKAIYSEKLLTGYRWYDANKIQPKFAFGFGLSYTCFEYSDLNLYQRPYNFQLTNAGGRDGWEVCQVYVRYTTTKGPGTHLLKDFQKVFLKVGKSRRVSFNLTQRDLSTWNAEIHEWEPVGGPITVTVGPSSDHQPLQGLLSRIRPEIGMEDKL